MLEEYKTEIEKIISQNKCTKAYKCYNSGLKMLCKAKDIGLDSFVECLEREPNACDFSFPFGLMYLCQCPLRIYIAKEMNS